MNVLKETIGDTMRELERERDELRVQLRLAKMEVSEEWEEIEDKFAKLESKAKQLGKATAEASKEIGAAATLLGEEIRAGFKKLAEKL